MPQADGQRPNCGPPPDTRPEDVTTWPRCGECRACEVEAKIASGEIKLIESRLTDVDVWYREGRW